MSLQRKILPLIGKVVRIEWLDAQSADAWTPIEDLALDTPPLIQTYGLLIAADESCVVVVQNVDKANDAASCGMTIPLGMVTSVTLLVAGKDFYFKRKAP